MNEANFCPYCDEFVNIEITDDYYFTKEGETFAKIECPKCRELIQISWESIHKFQFRKED
jgi:hypothetical protein